MKRPMAWIVVETLSLQKVQMKQINCTQKIVQHRFLDIKKWPLIIGAHIMHWKRILNNVNSLSACSYLNIPCLSFLVALAHLRMMAITLPHWRDRLWEPPPISLPIAPGSFVASLAWVRQASSLPQSLPGSSRSWTTTEPSRYLCTRMGTLGLMRLSSALWQAKSSITWMGYSRRCPTGWTSLMALHTCLMLMGRESQVLIRWKTEVKGCWIVSGWCQDGNTSSRAITEVKHLELNQSSEG